MKKLITILLFVAASSAYGQIPGCNSCDTLPAGATLSMWQNQTKRNNNATYALFWAKVALNDSVKFDSIALTYGPLISSYDIGSDTLIRKVRSDAAHTTGVKQKVLNTILKILTSF
jgi:hypothetical protein